MSPPSYYFINHTRKEFCSFDNNKPIFQELTEALHWNIGWTFQDFIHIDKELSNSTVLIEYLMTEKGYKYLDLESDSDEDSDPDSVA